VAGFGRHGFMSKGAKGGGMACAVGYGFAVVAIDVCCVREEDLL
jgi:hypothetical protein